MKHVFETYQWSQAFLESSQRSHLSLEADNMLIELHRKSSHTAISPIFYVEIRLLVEISSLIGRNCNLMAEIQVG